MGHITGCKGKTVLDCTGLIMGCLGGETKGGERERSLGDLARDRSGKIIVIFFAKNLVGK